jgi:dolichol-phosphate mannosyltransferase
MRDQYFGWREAAALMETLFLQALPLWVCGAAIVFALPRALVLLNVFLLVTRFGVLVGVSRAYSGKPWTYWISPLIDLAAVLRIIASALQRRQIWRDRVYVRRRSGRYELEGVRSPSS